MTRRARRAGVKAWAWKEKGKIDVQDILPWPPSGYIKDSRRPGYVLVSIRELSRHKAARRGK